MTQRGTTAMRPDQAASLRRAAFSMAILLLIEFALGIGINLYVTLPGKDAGGNVGTGFGHTVANGPASVAVHTILGLLLVVNAVVILVRAWRAGSLVVTLLAGVGALSLVGAAVSGSAYVGNGHSAASLGMAMAWAVGMLAYLVVLFLLGGATTPATGG